MARDMIPSDDEKVRLFRDSVYYEIVHTFGVPAEFTGEQLESHPIGETINFSRHVHARALSHFLFRRPTDDDVPKKQDDAFAEDFGFDVVSLGLSKTDRKHQTLHKDLNKGLIHITYGRVTGATHKPWTNPVLRDLLPVTIAFMKHIRDKEQTILPSRRELFDNQGERDGWRDLLTCLERCQQGERLRFKSGFNAEKTWYQPFTESGSITALYGTREKETPPGAVVLCTATNTTITAFPAVSNRRANESS